MDDAIRLLEDVAARIVNRPQRTTDSMATFKEAVSRAFVDIDFAMVKKDYESLTRGEAHRRYSPARCGGMEIKVISGDPSTRGVRPATSNAKT